MRLIIIATLVAFAAADVDVRVSARLEPSAPAPLSPPPTADKYGVPKETYGAPPPAPVYEAPLPVYAEPAPVYTAPPVYTTPAPVYTAPPVYPVYTSPPVYPVYGTPAPVYGVEVTVRKEKNAVDLLLAKKKLKGCLFDKKCILRHLLG